MRHKVIAILFALFVFNGFFYPQGFTVPGTVGYCLYVLGLIVIVSIGYWDKLKDLPKWPLSFLAVSFCTAGLTLLRSNPAHLFILNAVIHFSGIFAVYTLAKPNSKIGALSEYPLAPLGFVGEWIRSAFAVVFEHSPNGLGWLKNSLFRKKKTQTDSEMAAVLRGVLITVPILVVITALLINGDLAFAKLIEKIFDFNIPELNLSQRLIANGIMIGLVAPTLFIRFKTPFVSSVNNKQYAKYPTELMILSGSVATLLAIFIVVESPYLFTQVAETELSQFGVDTYSEYVKRGFGELGLVALISYGVSGLAYLVFRQTHTNTKLRNTNTALLVTTLVFILSIFRRVALYIEYHGLSLARVYGSAFLLMVIGLTLSLIARHYLKQKNYQWHIAEALIVLLGVIGPALINSDALIASTAPPTVNHEVDYLYQLRDLSPDAYKGWIEGYEDALTIVDEFAGKTKAELTDEDQRKLSHAYYFLSGLHGRLYSLTKDYGTPEDLELLAHNWPGYRPDYYGPHNGTWYSESPALKHAYVSLLDKIDLTELRQKEEQAGFILEINY